MNDHPLHVPISFEGSPAWVTNESYNLIRGNIFIPKNVTREQAHDVLHQILYLNKTPIKVLKVWIDNNGGCCDAMFSILNMLELSPKKIMTINCGNAFSAAAVVLASGTPGLRLCFPDAKTLIHGVSGGAYGKEHELAVEFKDIEFYNNRIYNRLSKITGKTVEFLREFMKEDKYVYAKEGLKLKLFDKIVTKSVMKAL